MENVTLQGKRGNDWGTTWNAAQFLANPIQNRNRVIGGRHPQPHVYRPYRRANGPICPSILATEYKGAANDSCRASRFYGRKLTVEECAYHMGLTIPTMWYDIPDWFACKGSREIHWLRNIYEAIGNGVPVYMAKAFGSAV